jgi:hypothetical protein
MTGLSVARTVFRQVRLSYHHLWPLSCSPQLESAVRAIGLFAAMQPVVLIHMLQRSMVLRAAQSDGIELWIISLPSRCKAVDRGHRRRSKELGGHMGSVPWGAVAALCCCTTSPAIDTKSSMAKLDGDGLF